MVRYNDPALAGQLSKNGKRKDTRSAKPLDDIATVRRSDGTIDPALEKAAIASADQFRAQLVTGAIATLVVEPQAGYCITIAAGFALVLNPESGKYVTTTRRYREMCNIRDLLFGSSSRQDRRAIVTQGLLNPTTKWSDWTAAAAMILVRNRAKHFNETGKGGVRRTEVIIDAIYTVATWLRGEQKIPDAQAKPRQKWRRELKDVWTKITKQRTEPRKPRHTKDEVTKIFRRPSGAERDPRSELAATLGYRWFHHAYRRDVDLEAGTHGTLTVPPFGQRRLPVEYPLTPEQRTALEETLTNGYLADCEVAFQSGAIANYPILPQGVLERDGRIGPRDGLTHLIRPTPEPRIVLAVELGAEYRVGQVLTARRSDLSFQVGENLHTERGLPAKECTECVLHIRGNYKKPGEKVVLTPEQSECLLRELRVGYLSENERRYAVGLLSDYCLFPAGKLVQGKAPAAETLRPLGREAALRFFHELEMLSGVKRVDGRGWYGLRRVSTDLAPEYSSDARVLNAQGGWRESETRAGYQDRTNLDVRREAALVRRAVRLGSVGLAGTPRAEPKGGAAGDEN